MTDRYGHIREALAMRPTPKSWTQGIDDDAAYAMFCCQTAAEAAFIAACDPDTIRALLAERDALAAEVERLRDALEETRNRNERELKEWIERGRTEDEKAAALKWLEDMRGDSENRAYAQGE
jgi:hypothetical protein